MTSVALLAPPGLRRSRSNALYAERLERHAPDGADWRLRWMPELPGDPGARLSSIVVPPLLLPAVRDDAVHVVADSHAGALRFLRRPAVVTVQDLIALKVARRRFPAAATPRLSARAGLWLRWNLSALRRAALRVAPSRATADALRELLGLDAEIVPHGVDAVFAEAPSRATGAALDARLGALRDRPFLLQVSCGFFYKNDAGFLESFTRLAERHRELGWVRVGSPPDPALVQRIARNGWGDRVRCLGDLSEAELAALYRRATALLFPSWDEGFGWPPLEAMAAGCPVVSSGCGALAETAAPAGLTAAPWDAEGLAAQVTRLVEHKALREETIEAGRAHARRYTWSRTTAHMRDVYERAARCG